MNVSWRIRMYHGAYKCIVAAITSYWWVMSYMNESCHIWMSHVTYEWVMSHMNESWRIWMSHFTYEWVMSHMNESFHIWISHIIYECIIAWGIAHMNESWHMQIYRDRNYIWLTQALAREWTNFQKLAAQSLQIVNSLAGWRLRIHSQFEKPKYLPSP